MYKGQLKDISDSGTVFSCFGMFNEFDIAGRNFFLAGNWQCFSFVFNCPLPAAGCFNLSAYYFLPLGGLRI